MPVDDPAPRPRASASSPAGAETGAERGSEPVPDAAPELLLGQGRSARVYRAVDADGTRFARKVFRSGILTRAVQYTLLGAANPYAWNEHALRAAFLRRRILHDLVPLWFGDRVRVARATGHGWNREHQAFELRCELVDGRPPALHHPLSRRGRREVRELRRDVQAPLQRHLAEAGFDGLLWQAGLGNPVAFANFLLEEDADGTRRWVWIDLESGVPALFPADPRALWRTYLPLSRKHGGPLYDHVDVPRLREHLRRHARAIDAHHGPGHAHRLHSDVAALEVSQAHWCGTARLERSLASQVVKGKLSPRRAEFFRRREPLWWARESGRATRGLVRRGARWTASLARRVLALPWRRIPRATLRFVVSQRYRERLSRDLVALRVEQWAERGLLAPAHRARLLEATRVEGSSVWLSDFAVHVAIKPIVKALEWTLVPALLMAGTIDETTAGIAILAGGTVSRSLYTLGRVLQDLLRGRPAPWLALWIGALPVIGNLAFPLQIVWRGQRGDDLLARFLLYDGCTVVGRRLPIWGGRDTLTEHLANQLPDRVLRARRARRTRAGRR